MPEKSRLLVLDDDKAHAEAAAESLERAGYQCTIATSGTEGLKLLESKPFDLILTDLVMRDVSGLDIVRRSRKQWPETEIIVMTGYPSYETALEAMDEGAYDYLNKPIDLNILRVPPLAAPKPHPELRASQDVRTASARQPPPAPPRRGDAQPPASAQKRDPRWSRPECRAHDRRGFPAHWWPRGPRDRAQQAAGRECARSLLHASRSSTSAPARADRSRHDGTISPRIFDGSA